MPYLRLKKYAWIKDISVGDILMEGDTPRVVRSVSHTGRTSVTFTIRHCSWTTRCYTVLNESDLRTRRFRPTGKRKRLDAPIDRAIREAIDKREIKMHCCDVDGID